MTDKISRAKTATEEAVRARDLANTGARQAVDLMLRTLREIIGEESLSGLPNLANANCPYRGVRVMSKKTAAKLPMPPRIGLKSGRRVVCINIRGHLVYAWRNYDLTTDELVVPLDEVKAGMAEDIAEAAIAAIDYHLGGCNRAIQRYSDLRKLSTRLVAALTEETE